MPATISLGCAQPAKRIWRGAKEHSVERVLVVGCAGSGKSALARRLASLTGLPLIELDRAFWRPGWTSDTG